jgi:hypothetical protein
MHLTSLCYVGILGAVLLTSASCGGKSAGVPPDAGPSSPGLVNDAGIADAGPFTGSDTCTDLIHGWSTTLTESNFSSQISYDAYQGLNKCACMDTTTASTPAGCADICTEPANGTTTPNFCNGVTALSQCLTCLTSICMVEYTVCMAH